MLMYRDILSWLLPMLLQLCEFSADLNVFFTRQTTVFLMRRIQMNSGAVFLTIDCTRFRAGKNKIQEADSLSP
jgi:hypothetical protein